MKRQILFKAKDFKGNWHIGTYYYGVMYPTSFNAHYVNDEQIDEETLGQYTGLEDKNGIKIFEGDTIKIQLPLGGFWGNVKQEKFGIVKYESDHGGFIVEWEYSKNQHHITLSCDIAFEGEVMGNIHGK